MPYLLDLADVLRAAGLAVVEVAGWRTRARRGGAGSYVPGTPTHLMIHHTASPRSSDGQRDVDYIIGGSPDAPITNMYVDRAGTFWVCASGATNTNGKGADTWGGGVPADRMNEYALSIEIANTGTGEPYPDVQQRAVVAASAAVCTAYGISPHHVRGHFEWAPTRKIDPSGPSAWATSGKWDMDRFRRDVATAIHHPSVPIEEDDDMAQPHPIRAVYAPVEQLVAVGKNKTFGLLPDGSVRHLSGPDAESAQAAGVPVFPIRGPEHYNQCDALDAVWRSKK